LRLGKANCNECGGIGTRALVIHRRGVFSECSRCGFVEWEWAPGDKLDYLRYLAEIYGVPYSLILGALEKVWDPNPLDGEAFMDVIVDCPFEGVFHYAKSGGGLIAINGRAKDLENRIEFVLEHETVHLVIWKLFANAPLSYSLRAQKMWDYVSVPEARSYYEEKYLKLGI